LITEYSLGNLNCPFRKIVPYICVPAYRLPAPITGTDAGTGTDTGTGTGTGTGTDTVDRILFYTSKLISLN